MLIYIKIPMKSKSVLQRFLCLSLNVLDANSIVYLQKALVFILYFVTSEKIMRLFLMTYHVIVLCSANKCSVEPICPTKHSLMVCLWLCSFLHLLQLFPTIPWLRNTCLEFIHFKLGEIYARSQLCDTFGEVI